MALLEIRGLPHCPIENGVWNHVSYGAILKTWPGSPAVDQQVAEQNNSSSVVKPQTGETVECPGRNICIRTLATTGLGTSTRAWKVSYKRESQVSTHCNNPHVKIQKRLLYLHWLAWVRCWRSIRGQCPDFRAPKAPTSVFHKLSRTSTCPGGDH